MPSGQDFVNRLREEARRTLTPHVDALREEIQILQKQITGSVEQLEHKLLGLKEFEPPDSGPVVAEAVAEAVSEAVEEVVRRKDQEKGRLAKFAATMRKAETQEEILTMLLDGACQCAPRTALFVLKGDQFAGWSLRGYSENTAARITSEPFSLSASPALMKALEANEAVHFSELTAEPVLSEMLSEGFQGAFHAVALRAMRRPVAVLVAVPEQGGRCDLDALALMVDVTGLCLENVALKILQELKASAPAARGRKVTTSGAATEISLQPEPVSQTPVTEAAVPETQTVMQELVMPEPEPAPAEQAPAATPAFPPLTLVDETADAALQEGEAIAKETVASEPQASAASAEMPVEGSVAMPPSLEITDEPPEMAVPTEQPTPPVSTSFVPRDVPIPRQSEDERLHSDAKRFARLLVSEIKLYNEQRVAEGRSHRDLYVRLKRDIDRSREMYEKRVSPTVSHRVDYFHDEVIRILAENDPTMLGSDYPGPCVGPY